jgi:hypothetical protein
VRYLKVSRKKLEYLMHVYAKGNYNRFARELEIDPSQLHRFMNSGVGAGKKFIGGLIRFCERNNISFNEYIEY